jgi:hypothetical protein
MNEDDMVGASNGNSNFPHPRYPSIGVLKVNLPYNVGVESDGKQLIVEVMHREWRISGEAFDVADMWL